MHQRVRLSSAPGREIYRVYKRVGYKAVAAKGYLVMDGEKYSSLHQLSRAVGPTSENAWENWYVTDAAGNRALIKTLRK